VSKSKKPPKKPTTTLDEPFSEEEEETTSPDHRKASVVCPHCGGGHLASGMTCDVCWGVGKLNKEAFDRWKRRR
jgi:hypothetical protein